MSTSSFDPVIDKMVKIAKGDVDTEGFIKYIAGEPFEDMYEVYTKARAILRETTSNTDEFVACLVKLHTVLPIKMTNELSQKILSTCFGG